MAVVRHVVQAVDTVEIICKLGSMTGVYGRSTMCECL